MSLQMGHTQANQKPTATQVLQIKCSWQPLARPGACQKQTQMTHETLNLEKEICVSLINCLNDATLCV